MQADEDIYLYYRSRNIGKISNGIEEFGGNSSAHVVGKRAGNVRKYTSFEDQVLSLTNFEGKIPSDIWLRCQYRLEKNRQIGNSGKGKNTWLSGLLKCGNCGYSLTVRKWHDKKYLYCSGRVNLHICDIPSFSQPVDELESEVQKELEKILEECNREQIPVENTEKEKKIRKQLREIEDKIQKLMACMQEASDISMKYINSELEKLDERKSELLKQYETPKKNEKQYYKGIDFEELDFEEKKMTAQAFIERINVYDDEIEIIWKV